MARGLKECGFEFAERAMAGFGRRVGSTDAGGASEQE